MLHLQIQNFITDHIANTFALTDSFNIPRCSYSPYIIYLHGTISLICPCSYTVRLLPSPSSFPQKVDDRIYIFQIILCYIIFCYKQTVRSKNNPMSCSLKYPPKISRISFKLHYDLTQYKICFFPKITAS